MEDNDFYEYDEGYIPEPEGPPPDHVVDEAKDFLKGFFRENKEKVYYFKQLEVMFEKPFFHWVTARAIKELVDEGYLGLVEQPLIEKTRVNFVFGPAGWRYYKRAMKESLRVIREYSHHSIARACGEQADVLFFNAFMGRGFLSHGEDTNEFEGLKWNKSRHNLDFIMEKDGIVYGCEVKNRFDYIEKEELDIKLDLCEYLGIKPVFIMRHWPKTYNNKIIKREGFVLIFESQIYPFGQEELVKRIKKILGMPVDCPRAIPSGIIDRFMKWHDKVMIGGN